MKDEARTAILVVGMHRSGTSAMSRTISLLGASLPGNLLAPGPEENPTGFWESRDFLECHDRFLNAVGSTWDDPLPLPDEVFTGLEAQRTHDELVTGLHRNFAEAQLCVIKDPRLCRLMPLWHRALATFGARPLAVLPTRNPLDVAQSLHRRNGFPRESSLALWFVHALMAERATRGMKRVFTSYDSFIEDPAAATALLAERLGCFSPEDVAKGLPAVEAYWRKDLRHHAAGGAALRQDATVPSWVQSLHGWLQQAVTGEPAPDVPDAIAQALVPALQLYGPLQRQLKDELGAAIVFRRDAEAAQDQARAEAVHLAAEKDRAWAETVELRLETERLRGENRLIELDQARTRQDLGESVAAAAAARDEQRQWQARYAVIEQTLGEARERIAALDGAREGLLTQAGMLRAEADRFRVDADAARTESEDWRRKTEYSEKIGAVLRQQARDLAAEIRRGEAARAALGEEKLAWQSRGEALRQALDAAAIQQDHLLADLAAAIRQGEAQEAAASEARGENDALRRRHASETTDLRFRLEDAAQTGRSLSVLHRQAEETIEMLHHVLRRGRGGVAPLRLLRRVIEAAWLWPWLRGGFFEPGHYRLSRPAGAAWLSDLAHYLLVGRARDLAPTPLFDPVYYRRRNADVALSGIDPLFHYLRHGGAEGRKPSPGFDGAFYLRRNPDVAQRKANPLRHYLRHGWREGRNPNEQFDIDFYQRGTGCTTEPLSHYLSQDAAAKPKPGPVFDPRLYLVNNPDVARRKIDPLLHYLEQGAAEGRAFPSPAPVDPLGDLDRSGFRLLIVAHGLGGGTDRHCRDLERLLGAEGADVWKLESVADGLYRLSNGARGVTLTHDLSASDGETGLMADLRRLKPALVHVHHLIGYGRRLEGWLADLGLPYDMTLHDYAVICPRVTLLDDRDRYCGGPADTRICDRCVGTGGAHSHLQGDYDRAGSTERWRGLSRDFLAGARKLFVPDEDVADRLSHHFPGLVFAVRPHPEEPFAVPARRPAGGRKVRIAVIGGIGVHKGFHILAACARAAQRDGLPLTFVVMGDVCAPSTLAGLPTIELGGRYRQEDLPDLIEQSGCHAAAFFSLWPETYMYTLSEALRAGLPPVVFDLGAPARRLRELGWGTMLAPGSLPEEINKRLLEIAVDHPLPRSDMRLGRVYPSMIEDYYGFERT